MASPLRPPGSGRFSAQRDPAAVRRKVLEVLLELDRPAGRLEIQPLVFGTTKLGATAIASAIGTLRTDGLVELRPGGRYRAAEHAADALEVAEEYLAASAQARGIALSVLADLGNPVRRLVTA